MGAVDLVNMSHHPGAPYHGSLSVPREVWKHPGYAGSYLSNQVAPTSSNFAGGRPIIARQIWSPYTQNREHQYGPAPNYKWSAPAFPLVEGNSGRVPEMMAFEEFTKTSGFEGTQAAGATGQAPHWQCNFPQRPSNYSTGSAREKFPGEFQHKMRYARPPQTGQDQRGNTDPHMSMYRTF